MQGRNSDIKTLLRRATCNITDSLASEALTRSTEHHVGSQNYSEPLRRASITVIWIANEVCRILGINKNSPGAERISKHVFEDISADKAKFKALKEALRNKELLTNAAIRQCLLDYDESTDRFKFEKHCKKYGKSKFTSVQSIKGYQSSYVVTKEKKWVFVESSLWSSV